MDNRDILKVLEGIVESLLVDGRGCIPIQREAPADIEEYETIEGSACWGIDPEKGSILEEFSQEFIRAIESEVVMELYSKLIESSNSILLDLGTDSHECMEKFSNIMREAFDDSRNFTHVILAPLALSLLQTYTGDDFLYLQDEIEEFTFLSGTNIVGHLTTSDGKKIEVILRLMDKDIVFYSEGDIVVQVGDLELSEAGVILHYKTHLRK